MRKSLCILLLFVLFGSLQALFAQDDDIYVKTVLISKVYPHELGYRLLYIRGDLSIGELYVPREWFESAGGRGDLILGMDRSYPYLSIFWVNGEFSHIRLYLYNDLRHSSYGTFRNAASFVDRFEVDTLEMEF